MNKWFVLMAVFLALVTSGAFVFKAGLLTVEPRENAFVIKNGLIVEKFGPGLHWSQPFFRTIAYIDVASFRSQTAKMLGILSDGSTCPVKVSALYKIADPHRAIAWRLANAKDVSHEGILAGRNDYVEASRKLERSLLAAMKQITPRQASRGAIERWIWKNGAKKLRLVENSDGTQIVGLRVMSVGCSMIKKLGKPAKRPVFKLSKPRKFKNNQRAVITSKVHKGMPFSTEVILRDNRAVIIDNLAVEYVITNSDRFEKTFGNSVKIYSLATNRINPVVKSAIRRQVSSVRAHAFADFDLAMLFRPDSDLAVQVEKWGIRLVNIATDKTSYRVYVRNSK